MQLEAGAAWNRSRRSGNFRRIVRKSGNVIAVECGGIRELAAGDLHALAGVAREADHRLIQHFALAFYWWNLCKCRHSSPEPPLISELPPIPSVNAAHSLRLGSLRFGAWLVTR